MDNWTRITDDPDSLPEVGTPVLGLLYGFLYAHVVLDLDRGWMLVTPNFTHKSGWTWNMRGVAPRPTHWQPLPEPPRE